MPNQFNTYPRLKNCKTGQFLFYCQQSYKNKQGEFVYIYMIPLSKDYVPQNNIFFL